MNEPHLWASDVSYYWRTTEDILIGELAPTYDWMFEIYSHNLELRDYAGPNAFNDADMLIVGLEGLNDIE